jgi:Putative metallopeptidase
MREHVLAIVLVASLLQFASCSGEEDAKPAVPRGNGRVKIVYDDAGIKPENRDVVKQIKDSGVFDRLADRATKTLALPHDLEVKVSDDVPFDDPSTDVEGKTIFWPAGWLNTTRMLLAEFVPDVIRDKGVPKAIGAQNFTPDTLNIWANQFILGHEFGHALIHQLTLPMTGMEEDSADGFATFFTIIDKETGPNAALGAAVLFDAFAAKKPNVTMEDFSSDHPVVQQRIFNFLSAVVGSDPQKLENSLVTDGYVPKTRAPLSRKEWTQLNYGWWKALEPHIADTYKKEADAARAQARKDLDEENAALPGKIRELRRQQSSQ